MVGVAHGLDHFPQRYVVREQFVRIHGDLILLDEAAHRCHLGHARNALQGIAHIPVLEASELLQVEIPGLVDERVLEHPPDARGVRS